MMSLLFLFLSGSSADGLEIQMCLMRRTMNQRGQRMNKWAHDGVLCRKWVCLWLKSEGSSLPRRAVAYKRMLSIIGPKLISSASTASLQIEVPSNLQLQACFHELHLQGSNLCVCVCVYLSETLVWLFCFHVFHVEFILPSSYRKTSCTKMNVFIVTKESL